MFKFLLLRLILHAIHNGNERRPLEVHLHLLQPEAYDFNSWKGFYIGQEYDFLY